jgi:hypothetical protein
MLHSIVFTKDYVIFAMMGTIVAQPGNDTIRIAF